MKNLLNDESYTRRTLPYLKPEYFTERTEKLVYQQIDHFVNKYNSLPTREALIIEIDTEGKVTYTEQVAETTEEPNYDAAIAALN